MRSMLSRSLRSAALAASLSLPLGITPAFVPAPAMAQTLLPPPYLSYALDALLLPIDDTVRATFGLAPEDVGVFVLATAPGGLAESAGLLPGDVLDYVQGEEILSPEDLDAIIWLETFLSDYPGALVLLDRILAMDRGHLRQLNAIAPAGHPLSGGAAMPFDQSDDRLDKLIEQVKLMSDLSISLEDFVGVFSSGSLQCKPGRCGDAREHQNATRCQGGQLNERKPETKPIDENSCWGIGNQADDGGEV